MSQELIDIFQDTLRHCEVNLINFGKVTSTKLYNFDELRKYLSEPKDNIVVENIDTIGALCRYNIGKTAVINMASAKRPGGGVKKGSKAQEEGLFRCSNLSFLIDSGLYPLQESEGLYTTNATFFRDFNYNYMDPITCDVITVAAHNLNSVKMDRGTYVESTKQKIRLMLEMCADNDINNVILGAWGCGVFKNDPKEMSNFFHEILIKEGYSGLFDKVIFAIINDHNSVDNNYTKFKNTFEKTTVE